MKTTTELLAGAAGTGEIVTIVYQGGSKPGQARQVIPNHIKAGRLEAIDISTSTPKTYFLDMIASVVLSDGQESDRQYFSEWVRDRRK